MIRSRLLDGASLIPEGTASIGMRRLGFLAAHVLRVNVEIRSLRQTSRFDTSSVRRLLRPFVLLDYVHGELVNLGDLGLKRLPLLLLELIEIHGHHTSLGDILLVVVLPARVLPPLVVRNSWLCLLEGT